MAAGGLTRARRRVAAAAARVGRDPREVTVVVVTKNRSHDEILAVYDEGQRVFAENRADALTYRIEGGLPDDVTWHFVGSLQRRKVKVVAPLVGLLHSMDRAHLEAAWAKQSDPPPVLLQVNLAEEPQKHGYRGDEIIAAAERLAALGVEVRGLMIIPPIPSVPEDSRRWFLGLAELGAELQTRYPAATELSMGMSDDFEVAVECGATMIRLGRTIFEAVEGS